MTKKKMYDALETGVHAITAPLGRWLKRTDERPNMKTPIMAYGMENCVLVIWSDGSHTTRPTTSLFPASNWKIWEEVE